MRLLKLLLLVIALLLLVLFIRQNLTVLNQQVSFQLNLYIKHLESPPHALWEILLFTLLLGIIIAGLYSFVTIWRQRSLNRKLLQDLEFLKAEVAQLKPSATATTTEGPPVTSES